MNRCCRLLAPAALALAAFAVAPPASAQHARLDAIGGVDLLQEDDSNIFMNPALMPVYTNRAWFSLGVAGEVGDLSVTPHGGAAVRIKDIFNIGLVLNRSPEMYEFDNAFWPVLTQYMPTGPGGELDGPDGPVETTAPMRFPMDLFIGIGDPWSKARVGLNLYYAGGASRFWDIDDRDQDGAEESRITKRQTHLISATLGVSGGSSADTVRPEGWLRFTFASAWIDEQGFFEVDGSEEPSIDRIVSMDRDLRIGGGFRIHLGDPKQGFVVTPGVQYDFATGGFRFDDNLASPDLPDEKALRVATGHDLRAGVGVAWRGDDLLINGTVSVRVRALNTVDTLDAGDDGDEIFTIDRVDLALPEVSIGAEYALFPELVLRAGLKSTVIGGRTIGTDKEALGTGDSPPELQVIQTIDPLAVAATLSASGGLGLRVKRFKADAIFGSLFVGPNSVATGGPFNFFSRVDLAFSFD